MATWPIWGPYQTIWGPYHPKGRRLESGGNLKRFLGAFKLCLNSAFLEADNDSARTEKKIQGYTTYSQVQWQEHHSMSNVGSSQHHSGKETPGEDKVRRRKVLANVKPGSKCICFHIPPVHSPLPIHVCESESVNVWKCENVKVWMCESVKVKLWKWNCPHLSSHSRLQQDLRTWVLSWVVWEMWPKQYLHSFDDDEEDDEASKMGKSLPAASPFPPAPLLPLPSPAAWVPEHLVDILVGLVYDNDYHTLVFSRCHRASWPTTSFAVWTRYRLIHIVKQELIWSLWKTQLTSVGDGNDTTISD